MEVIKMYEGNKGNVQIKIEPGTLEKYGIVKSEFNVKKNAKLSIDLKVPYVIKVSGTKDGIATYNLNKEGTFANNTAQVSKVGFFSALKALIDAYAHKTIDGGITRKNVDEIGKGVDNYNNMVENLDKVKGKTVVMLDRKTEIGIDDLSDEEKSKLELIVK